MRLERPESFIDTRAYLNPTIVNNFDVFNERFVKKTILGSRIHTPIIPQPPSKVPVRERKTTEDYY